MLKKILLNNFILLLILSSIWGSSFLAIKIAVKTINPISIASFRLIIGTIVLAFFFYFSNNKLNFSKKILFYIFLTALLGNLIPFILISWSEIYISSSLAGLLLSTAPLFALILSHFFTIDDKFNTTKLLGILIGLIGVILLIGYENILELFSGNIYMLLPKLAVIVAALGYVISSIIAYSLKELNPLNLTFITIFIASIISLPFMFYYESKFFSYPSTESIIAVIYLGIMPTAVAYLLRFYIISKAGPVFLSYVAYLIPIFSIFWGYTILNEKIILDYIFALFFILLGIYIGQIKSNVKKNLP